MSYRLTTRDTLSRKTVPIAKPADLHIDLTRRLLLEATMRVLTRTPLSSVTYRAIGAEAQISERTVFRHFASRGDFLEAIASAITERLDLPPPPRTIDELQASPRELYRCFEGERELTKAVVHSELHDQMRTKAKPRWAEVRKLTDGFAPKVAERKRKLATVNFQYVLSANAWHSYRFHFHLTLDESIECAQTTIQQTLSGLRTNSN